MSRRTTLHIGNNCNREHFNTEITLVEIYNYAYFIVEFFFIIFLKEDLSRVPNIESTKFCSNMPNIHVLFQEWKHQLPFGSNKLKSMKILYFLFHFLLKENETNANCIFKVNFYESV